jgi:2-oxo-3-hexenedioate decarboxylase
MLFIGDPQPLSKFHNNLRDELATFLVTLCCDSVLREVGRGVNVLGSPLIAIAHLIEVLSKQTQFAPLHAGEIVTTGTITTAQPVCSGQSWTTQLSGIALPGLTLKFTQ